LSALPLNAVAVLLGACSVNTFPRQPTLRKDRTTGRGVFCVVLVVLNSHHASKGPETDCADEARQQSKLQTRPLVRERKCLQITYNDLEEKFFAGPRWWPDTRTDRPTDRR
jgi:hypothetical protein